jgi:hypothetical protein
MNYITYRYKLFNLNFKKNLSEKSILKDIVEAREKGNEETLEKLYAVLNTNKINYDKNRYKLFTLYYFLQY